MRQTKTAESLVLNARTPLESVPTAKMAGCNLIQSTVKQALSRLTTEVACRIPLTFAQRLLAPLVSLAPGSGCRTQLPEELAACVWMLSLS
jgi:hypothetical protein